jgi:hypothetical protein
MNIFSTADINQILEGLREPTWKVPVRILEQPESNAHYLWNYKELHNRFKGYKIDGIVPVYKQKIIHAWPI